mgnify:FL=1
MPALHGLGRFVLYGGQLCILSGMFFKMIDSDNNFTMKDLNYKKKYIKNR